MKSEVAGVVVGMGRHMPSKVQRRINVACPLSGTYGSLAIGIYFQSIYEWMHRYTDGRMGGLIH